MHSWGMSTPAAHRLIRHFSLYILCKRTTVCMVKIQGEESHCPTEADQSKQFKSGDYKPRCLDFDLWRRGQRQSKAEQGNNRMRACFRKVSIGEGGWTGVRRKVMGQFAKRQGQGEHLMRAQVEERGRMVEIYYSRAKGPSASPLIARPPVPRRTEQCLSAQKAPTFHLANASPLRLDQDAFP